MKEKYGYTFHGKYFNLLNKYFDIVWNMERICETRNVAKKMFLNNQWKQKKKKKRDNLKTWESRCYSQLLTFLCLKLLKQSVLDIMIFTVQAISCTFAMVSLQYFYMYSTYVVIRINFLFSNEISYYI